MQFLANQEGGYRPSYPRSGGIKAGIEIMMMVGDIDIINGVTVVRIGDNMETKIFMFLLINIKIQKNKSLILKVS